MKREGQKEIVDFYIKNMRSMDNWDIVDLTADKILGSWLVENPGNSHILVGLASSGARRRRNPVEA